MSDEDNSPIIKQKHVLPNEPVFYFLHHLKGSYFGLGLGLEISIEKLAFFVK